MIKGSKAMHCRFCNRIVAWQIPNGRYDCGIERVYFQYKPYGNRVNALFDSFWCCDDCIPYLTDYEKSMCFKMK